MKKRLMAAAAIAGLTIAQAQQKKPYTTWSDYGGSSDSMQYSALTQIDKTNVSRLQLAWFHAAPGPIATVRRISWRRCARTPP